MQKCLPYQGKRGDHGGHGRPKYCPGRVESGVADGQDELLCGPISSSQHNRSGVTDVKEDLSTIPRDQRMGSRMSRFEPDITV